VVVVGVEGVGYVLVVVPGDLVVLGVLVVLVVDEFEVEVLSFDKRKYRTPAPISNSATAPMMRGILLLPPGAGPPY
jgi:hypothetical protein